MSLFPYPLIRPVFFSMEPERAHDLSLRLMSCPLLRLAFVQQAVQDPVTVAGLEFPNRIGLAAGLDKNAQCIDAFSAMGFGFAEVGTVTPLPQPGNPQPRMFRLPQAQAIINRMGFNNDGVEAFVRNVRQANFRRQRGRRPSMLLGLNIGKNAATPVEQASEDYQKALRAVYAHADYVAVNISSPNTRNLRTLQEDKALHGLLASLESCRAGLQQQYGKRVPLFVKIAPDLDDGQLDSIASALLSHDMDGVIATNTTVDRAGVQDLPHGAEEGGLSGAPLRDKSTQVIRQLRIRLGAGFPIIGAGGVMTPQDAVEKISAGADLVQLLTGFVYGGPPLVRRAAQAIANMRSTAQATPAEAPPQS